MVFLRKTLLLLLMIGMTCFCAYEIVAKSGSWPGGPLPGWYETLAVERRTPYIPWTGSLPLDGLIHEGHEAVTYYSFLLRRGPRDVSLVSRSARIPR
jgi:hypothetical protein